MRKIILLIAILFVAIGITIGFSINVAAQQPSIPSWIKNTAKWWGEGQISDDEFIKALQWLINQGILHVPSTSSSQPSTQSAQTTEQIATYRIGNTVDIDGITYHFKSVTTSKYYNLASAQGTYVIVQVDVKNTNDIPSTFDANLFILVTKDNNGTVRFYPIFHGSNIHDGMLSDYETLQSNLPITEDLLFDVPFDKDLKYVLIMYTKPQDSSSVKAFVELGMGKDFS